MLKKNADGVLRQTNLMNESAEYLAKREEVRLAEIELMRARERVAELRRGLPKGAEIQDYEFLDCSLYALPNGRATVPMTAAHGDRATAEGPASLAEAEEPVTKVRLS